MAAIPLFAKALPFLCFIAFLLQVSFATSKPTGLTMKLIRRDSLYPGNLTKAERIKKLFQLSAHHPEFSPNATADHPDTVRVPLDRAANNFLYVVETNIGSQLHPVMLLMDTGSGLIWTQCEPCQNCFGQEAPIYDSRASITYGKLPCSHPLCQDISRFRCVNNECVYNIGYGADTMPNSPRTKGIASFESFLFPVDDVNFAVVEDVIFGCSSDNQNFDFAGGLISGILGLSLAPDSLATQLVQKGYTSYRFSYCLVPFDAESQQPGNIKFGDDIPRPVGNLQTTLIRQQPGLYYYYLELLDISVGWQRLGFQPDIFSVRPDGLGGCLIDSGTLITTIDQNTIGRNAYEEVMQVFEAYYGSQGFIRVRDVVESLPLCYQSRPGFRDYMTMTLHFDGGDYLIDGKYVHYFSEEDGYFCVALRPASRTILGSWQQQNMRIIYNVDVDGLQWVRESCANAAP